MVPSARILAVSVAGGAFLALCVLAMQESLIGAESVPSAEADGVALALDPIPTATAQDHEANRTPTATFESEDHRVYITPVPTAESVEHALEDGGVTFEEYTQAVYNTMACLDEKGIEHTDPVYDEARVQYTYAVISPQGTDPRAVSAYDECWMKYERDIQAEWVKQNGASRTIEVVNEEGAVACAAELGIDATDFDDLLEQKRRYPQDPGIQHCLVIGTNGFDPSVPRDEDP